MKHYMLFVLSILCVTNFGLNAMDTAKGVGKLPVSPKPPRIIGKEIRSNASCNGTGSGTTQGKYKSGSSYGECSYATSTYYGPCPHFSPNGY